MPDETDNAGEIEPVEPLSGNYPGGRIKGAGDGAAEVSGEREKVEGRAVATGAEKSQSRCAALDLPSRPEVTIHPPAATDLTAVMPPDQTEADGGEEVGEPAARVPGTKRGHIRRFERGPRVPWWHSVLPALGLALLVGCLWGLMRMGPVPQWRFGWRQPETVGKGLVVIDPGHGGGDSGAVAQGVVEKDLNLDVGMRVGRSLRARGVDVRLTREDDHFVPLEDRVRFANALPGAVFVSIHFNDAAGEGRTNPQASGIETYYCQQKLTPVEGGWRWAGLFGRGKMSVPDARWAVQEGQTLAGCIQGTLIAGTGAENRGIKERSLYVTHRVLGPAVLVEGGFVSHPGEARKLGDPTYRQVLAECIAKGIVKYLRAAQTAPVAAVSP